MGGLSDVPDSLIGPVKQRDVRGHILLLARAFPNGPATYFDNDTTIQISQGLSWVASIHRIAGTSSSRKPAVPKVATYRILTQLGEYRGLF